MNDHWLKDHFKDTSTEELEAELWQLRIFCENIARVKMIAEELVRRNKAL